jgi:hypothetical protein
VSTTPDTLIDPRLLLLDGGDAVMDDAAAQRLDTVLYDRTEDLEEQDEAMGLDVFLENANGQSSSTSVLSAPGREFIEGLSRINVVRNSILQKYITSVHEIIPAHCPMGNSRDYPTLFMFSCDICNAYSTQSQCYLRTHQLSCKLKENKEEKEKLFICDRGDCRVPCTTARLLQVHIDNVHLREWKPRKCTIPGCTSDRVFETQVRLANHMQYYHNPIEPPMRCSFPECTSTTMWDQMHNYKEHLKLRHHLVFVAAQKPYLPTNVSDVKRSAASFQSTACPIGGSPACSKVFKRGADLTRHLKRGIHGLSAEEAQKITHRYNTGQEVEDLEVEDL